MPRTIESLSPDIAAPLKRLTVDLVRVAGANLEGLILHNDRTPGRRRSRNRVLKVVVLLHDADHYSSAGSWRRTAAALPSILAAAAATGEPFVTASQST